MHTLLANDVVSALGGPSAVQHIGEIALAALLGATLGAEREWRAKGAGLRTTTLVAMGSALFTILGVEAVHSSGSGDPSRVAAQVVSGIGFLGAGVIVKHGSSVRGLTTAATMWSAAGVGALCGAGLHLLAVIGALMIVFTNIAMRPVVQWMDQKSPNHRQEGDVGYTIWIRCSPDAQAEVRRLLFGAATGPGMTVKSFSSKSVEGENHSVATALESEIFSPQRRDSEVENSLREIIAHPQVSDVKWSVAPC